jgi:hypothetical protein
MDKNTIYCELRVRSDTYGSAPEFSFGSFHLRPKEKAAALATCKG